MAARTIPTGKRPAVGRGQLKAIHHKPLELIANEEGSVTLGWVDVGVYYARFIGTLSMDLSRQHNERVEAALARHSPLHYFADARALSTYDLDARSAFLRTVVAHRERFQSIVLLTWSMGITPIARELASNFGEPLAILADEQEFEERLLQVAPLARAKLDPNGWVLPPASTRAPR